MIFAGSALCLFPLIRSVCPIDEALLFITNFLYIEVPYSPRFCEPLIVRDLQVDG